MKEISGEVIGKIEKYTRDQIDLEKLIESASKRIVDHRHKHSFIAGSLEAAIGVAAISVGLSTIDPVEIGTKIPELLGSVIGGTAGGFVASTVGGIGIAMMGSAFAIPALAVTAIGASTGAIPGWFGAEIATQADTLIEILFHNISGVALVAFGCYMLFYALKDLWRAGNEFINYLKSLGITKISPDDMS